ncbi:hypothetical protein VB713_20405 [Anabaena cylindrica UHCC 0172]|uniref:hypothetical protein n=1 Tax=Anabaena cylindrica TaxID=1165 RepID=UPI002B1F207A|nr:hypothetical protein [Anabaena cylindrica]MEA5553304.1 hypothetical protein [Anabaena cylindrica UHCC 0172]
MIEDFPKFEKLPSHPHKQNEDKEIFYPQWNCFCCQDSGFVQLRLVQIIIPDYNYQQDKNVACQNPSCKKFHEKWGNIHLENFDTRFLPAICQKLDLWSRKDWRNTVKRQIDFHGLAKKMAMPGTTDRTENDNREVQHRKQEIQAISHNQWMRQTEAYLESEV